MFISLFLSGGVCLISYGIYNVSLYSSSSGISNGILSGISNGISNGISDGIFLVIPSEIFDDILYGYLYSVPTVISDK